MRSYREASWHHRGQSQRKGRNKREAVILVTQYKRCRKVVRFKGVVKRYPVTIFTSSYDDLSLAAFKQKTEP